MIPDFDNPDIQKITLDIQKKVQIVRSVPYRNNDFEDDMSELLLSIFPFGVLSGIRLYSPNIPSGDYGFEVDNIIHIQAGNIDAILLVEVKNQKILISKNTWEGAYENGRKNIKDQINFHLQVFREYLEPIAYDRQLKFFSLVVSSDANQEDKSEDGYKGSKIRICAYTKVKEIVEKLFSDVSTLAKQQARYLKASQSNYLDILRLSLPLKNLGHPELNSAIRYIDRCRRSLDESLYKEFKPTPERWVINGSAGMGKSVLLAYAAAVLSTGYELYIFDGVLAAAPNKQLEKLRFSPDPDNADMVVLTMSEKQLFSVKNWFDGFVQKIQNSEKGSPPYRFKYPRFEWIRGENDFEKIKDLKISALLIDEAHDLPGFTYQHIAHHNSQNATYLVVACDRHQKLKYAGTDARIIEGLDFTNKSNRLNKIYRNPAPIYIASLALMFRWFAKDGPKIIPSQYDLKWQFGLTSASTLPEEPVSISMKSDLHPANSWSHVVDSFPDANTAYHYLKREKLDHEEVLWVRFSSEDPNFNYEQLNKKFTYHNFRTHDSIELCDKYIKGQEFPVVIIEGFPRFMDAYQSGDGSEDHELKMWSFRRELYLCASRATGFLFFICTQDGDLVRGRINEEITDLVTSLSVPVGNQNRGTRNWSVTIQRTGIARSMSIFEGLEGLSTTDSKNDEVSTVAAPENDITTKVFKEPTPRTPMRIQHEIPLNPSEKTAPAIQNASEAVLSLSSNQLTITKKVSTVIKGGFAELPTSVVKKTNAIIPTSRAEVLDLISKPSERSHSTRIKVTPPATLMEVSKLTGIPVFKLNQVYVAKNITVLPSDILQSNHLRILGDKFGFYVKKD